MKKSEQTEKARIHFELQLDMMKKHRDAGHLDWMDIAGRELDGMLSMAFYMGITTLEENRVYSNMADKIRWPR